MSPLEQAEQNCSNTWQKVCRANELLIRAERRHSRHKIIKIIADEYFRTQTEYSECLKAISKLLIPPSKESLPTCLNAPKK